MNMNGEYAKGYLKGIYKGDGCWRRYIPSELYGGGNSRQKRQAGEIKTATIRLNDKNLIEEVCICLELAYCYTPSVREAVIPKSANTHYQINWIPTTVAIDLTQPPLTQEERRGYVAGFYDAEGCYSKHTYNQSWTLSISQRKKAPLELVGQILEEHNFKYTLLEHGKNSISRWTIRLSSTGGKEHKRFFSTFEPKKVR